MGTISQEVIVQRTEREGFSSRRVRVAPVQVSLITIDDIAVAMSEISVLAARMSMDRVTTALLVEAVTRVAHNVIVHAGRGKVTARRNDRGMRVEIVDYGPGFPADVLDAVKKGGHDLPSGSSLQLILNARMVDGMRIRSTPGSTLVILDKWWQPESA